MSFRKVLIAIDDSLLGDRAADVGVELAHAVSAEIALIHVVNPPGSEKSEGGYDEMSLSEHIVAAENRGKDLLAETHQRLGLNDTVQQFLEWGDPAEHILKIAGTWSADLIVVGSHGRAGILHFLLGSVSEAVTRQAICPVLVVPRR